MTDAALPAMLPSHSADFTGSSLAQREREKRCVLLCGAVWFGEVVVVVANIHRELSTMMGSVPTETSDTGRNDETSDANRMVHLALCDLVPSRPQHDNIELGDPNPVMREQE